jgi:hypothetical protein
MVIAHFVVNGDERESREVPEQWLREAHANHENVLLGDGNPYEIVNVEYHGEAGRTHARVELAAPRFARGG